MPVPSPTSPPLVMTLAAADPTSGGGLQGDVLTLASMGCHPLSVVTALCLRDTEGVVEVVPLDPELLVDQARLLLEDMPVRAFKVGLLGSVENIAAVAEILSDYPDIPLVLESELARLGRGSSGHDVLLAAHCELLLPQVAVLVLGRHEALRLAMTLTGDDEERDIASAVAALTAAGSEYVLLTGSGQPGPQVVNVLYGPDGVVRTDAWTRLPERFLGAGNTLSAAVVAALAHGMEIPEAVREAQEFTWQSLASAFRPGMGQALPDRFFWLRAGDAGGVP
jgi:hydroxymethylpyrimidine/phosphomethylpyrimidine kinase